ncbi:MAG: type II toxin-antitoxin system RelE/ParE family toxin [Ignavibacteria bacterium]|nr:type II toxin-antitoxin system RelE/ParE family toxin [Ignavibacteria bacterium]
MAKRIIWSVKAKEDRKEILEYWVRATGSSRYSIKLRNEFNLLTEHLLNFPKLGINVKNYDARCLIKGDYKIFYEINEDKDHLEIGILHIWDTRRNPDDLIKAFKT